MNNGNKKNQLHQVLVMESNADKYSDSGVWLTSTAIGKLILIKNTFLVVFEDCLNFDNYENEKGFRCMLLNRNTMLIDDKPFCLKEEGVFFRPPHISSMYLVIKAERIIATEAIW